MKHWLPDLVILLLLLGGSGLLYNSFWRLPPAGISAGVRWLFWAEGAILVGLPVLVVGLVTAVFRLRWRVNHHAAWWNHGCPQCESQALKRMKRRPFDHFLCRLGIPVRRYICADCRWHGRRIDQWRLGR